MLFLLHSKQLGHHAEINCCSVSFNDVSTILHISIGPCQEKSPVPYHDDFFQRHDDDEASSYFPQNQINP